LHTCASVQSHHNLFRSNRLQPALSERIIPQLINCVIILPLRPTALGETSARAQVAPEPESLNYAMKPTGFSLPSAQPKLTLTPGVSAEMRASRNRCFLAGGGPTFRPPFPGLRPEESGRSWRPKAPPAAIGPAADGSLPGRRCTPRRWHPSGSCPPCAGRPGRSQSS